MRKNSVNLKDVARLANVSIATVSRALSTPEMVGPETLQRVAEAIERLNYVPHGAARALRSRQSRAIGVIVPALKYAFYAAGVDAIQQTLDADGYTLLLMCHHYDGAYEVRAIRTLIERGVDAVVLVGLQHQPELFAMLRERKLPYILAWAHDPTGQQPSVGYSNRSAFRQLTEHLLAQGHRDLAMISGPLPYNDRARDRVAGVQEALAEHGIALRSSHLVETDYSIEQGGAAMRDLLARAPRPSAVLCGNDVLAVAAIQECREHGLAVPQDLSIVGFGDMEIGKLQKPAITTIRSPNQQIGEAAARHLLGRLAGKTVGWNEEIPVDVVVRDSVARPPENRRQ